MRDFYYLDLSRSPYIMYNALRLAGSWAVAANGSHTDTITEKISAGTPVRDALALSLLVMDYEGQRTTTIPHGLRRQCHFLGTSVGSVLFSARR